MLAYLHSRVESVQVCIQPFVMHLQFLKSALFRIALFLDLAPKSGPHSGPKRGLERVKAHCAHSLFPPPFCAQKTAPVLGPPFFGLPNTVYMTICLWTDSHPYVNISGNPAVHMLFRTALIQFHLGFRNVQSWRCWGMDSIAITYVMFWATAHWSHALAKIGITLTINCFDICMCR